MGATPGRGARCGPTTWKTTPQSLRLASVVPTAGLVLLCESEDTCTNLQICPNLGPRKLLQENQRKHHWNAKIIEKMLDIFKVSTPVIDSRNNRDSYATVNLRRWEKGEIALKNGHWSNEVTQVMRSGCRAVGFARLFSKKIKCEGVFHLGRASEDSSLQRKLFGNCEEIVINVLFDPNSLIL